MPIVYENFDDIAYGHPSGTVTFTVPQLRDKSNETGVIAPKNVQVPVLSTGAMTSPNLDPGVVMIVVQLGSYRRKYHAVLPSASSVRLSDLPEFVFTSNGAPTSVGPQGPPGPAGADGRGINLKGTVAAYTNLPTGLGVSGAGFAYLVNADGKMYVWSGTAWPPDGSGASIVGATGPQGPQGIQGATGAASTVAGPTGATGATGATGPRGSKWFTGTGVPATVSGSAVGDYYLDTATGYVYKLN